MRAARYEHTNLKRTSLAPSMSCSARSDSSDSESKQSTTDAIAEHPDRELIIPSPIELSDSDRDEDSCLSQYRQSQAMQCKQTEAQSCEKEAEEDIHEDEEMEEEENDDLYRSKSRVQDDIFSKFLDMTRRLSFLPFQHYSLQVSSVSVHEYIISFSCVI